MREVATTFVRFWLVSFLLIGSVRATDLRIVSTLRVGRSPSGLGLSRDNTKLFVANRADNTVSIVDLPAFRLAATIPACIEPWNVITSPVEDVAYISCRDGLVRLRSGKKVVERISFSGWPWDLAITNDGRWLFIAAEWSGLFRLDTRTSEVQQIDPTPAPVGLALTPDQRFLYVNFQAGGPGGRAGHDAIAVYDTRTGRRIATVLNLPNVGSDVEIAPDGQSMWIDGYNACASQNYDHLGCPIVPAGVLNIVSIPEHRLIRSIPWIREGGGSSKLRFADSPDLILITGQEPCLLRAKTAEKLACLPRLVIFDVTFPKHRNSAIAYASVVFENRVVMLAIAADELRTTANHK